MHPGQVVSKLNIIVSFSYNDWASETICILFRPFTGCYNKFYDKGTYTCVVCDQELFSSETKYDSGCGWPAFNEVLEQGRIKLTKDTSNGTFCCFSRVT